jgi:hypothetical protein
MEVWDLSSGAATVNLKKSSTILLGGRPNDGSSATAASLIRPR